MRHTSLLEYALIALVVVVALSATFTYVWPVIEIILGGFQVIGSALAGTK